MMDPSMDERTRQRREPKQVAPEKISRMFERLRDGVPDYAFRDDVTPFHSSYDNWHVFGKKKPTKKAASNRPSKTPSQASRPNSVRTHSDYEPRDEAHDDDDSDDSEAEKEPEVWVIARVSKHALRLEREFKQAVALRKQSAEDNVHFIKPLHFCKLPAKQPGDKTLAVSIVEAPGKNYLFDIVEHGPNFYRASAADMPQVNSPLTEGEDKQMPLLTFLDFAIGASECCEILHHGHEMVHGELRGDAFHYNKETNVVKLINFGSGARSFESGLTSAGWSNLTSERGVEHKLQFISPEQTGRLPAEPDSRTDLYSLGILFWTMLTGRPAYAGDTPLEIMQNVLSRRPATVTSLRPDVPDAISKIIQKMTHKAMDERYNSASGVKYDLQTLKKILMDGDTDALDGFKVASNDVSCFFKLPTHLVGRQVQRQTIVDVIERAARRFQKTQPLNKKGLMSLSSGTSLTSSDRLDSMLLDEMISDTTSSGTRDRESRINSIVELPSVAKQHNSSSSDSVPMARPHHVSSQDSVATVASSVGPNGRDSGTRP